MHAANSMQAKQVSNTIAVIGGGWAGFAAAVELVHQGQQVTLFEAARTCGGRARRLDLHGLPLDNGQHILLGAYRQTLALMRRCGLSTTQHLLHLPLQMPYPPGSGMEFIAPRLPAPLHLLFALLRAKGLQRADKMALARFSSTARWMDWELHIDCSVAELLERFEQTPELIRLLWRPLCLAALNTPLERASAQVFLHVLRDSLGARRSASDMLLPSSDLSSLLPEAATSYLQKNGSQVLTACSINTLQAANGAWQLQARLTSDNAASGKASTQQALAQTYQAVVLATPALTTARLLEEHAPPSLLTTLRGLEYEPITTCYLQYPPETRLARPFYALLDDPAQQAWGQFVFDRGQLHAAQAGLLAVVISAASQAAALPQEELAQQIATQLSRALQQAALAKPVWAEVITEKRATFACQVGLSRPPNASGLAGIWLAGDYTAGEYPATLEAACRSGVAAAQGILQTLRAEGRLAKK